MERRISRPLGNPSRGTTGPNRLRRVDRYVCGPLGWLWRDADAPVFADVGFGASPGTTLEWLNRGRHMNPRLRAVGIEIDRERVAAATPWASDSVAFLHGGFEVPLPQGWGRPCVIRAFNVLRQYPEAAVGEAWSRMTSRLAPGGVLVEGTCDEIGRVASWVTLDAEGPRSLTVSLRLNGLLRPSVVAERLPKVLIHKNVPGQPIHAWLVALDDAWARQAPWRVHGPRQRWLATVEDLRASGWPVLHSDRRWRLGEITLPWGTVG